MLGIIIQSTWMEVLIVDLMILRGDESPYTVGNRVYSESEYVWNMSGIGQIFLG